MNNDLLNKYDLGKYKMNNKFKKLIDFCIYFIL